NGFKSIKVKSMNQFPAMLQMLIASGYQICGYENNGSIAESKIEFIKFLQPQ
ncbi:MAG TPA: GNAT family N-acetyltransferase, partial [Shewanella frigidimarina]|nr:GNAT family N-acetyltransferase [Shewanella frigidimarina]